MSLTPQSYSHFKPSLIYTKVINSIHDFDAPTAEPDQPGPHPGPRPEGGIIQISHSLPGNSYTLPGNSYTLPSNNYTLPGSSYTLPGRSTLFLVALHSSR